MNIYIGKNYKNYTFHVSGSDIGLWQGQKVSQNVKRKKQKRRGQRKLILAALFTIQIDNYALTFHHDGRLTLTILKTLV